MPDVLALVSKAVFEKAARGLDVGSVWPTTSYASAGKGLTPLAEGGRLFLATVRPAASGGNEALWLVGVLDKPKFDGTQWAAKANVVAIRDVSSLKRSLKFATGTGLPTEAGKLGMSLQTPRVLTEHDAELLAKATVKASAKATPAKAKPAKAKSKPKREAAAPAGPAAQIDQSALLTRWQKTRSPRLADLLCCVPVDDEWTDRLASIARAQSHLAAPRIKKLPDDPRVTVFLVQLLQKAKWPGSGAKNCWQQVFNKLVLLRDSRAVAPLRAMVATPPKFLGAAFTKRCLEKIGATADTIAKGKLVADDAETKRLADAQEQDATVPAQGWFVAPGMPSAAADALIAKVWAAPDDLPLRSVIGDALLELGDPWGDLIALQAYSKKPDKKAIAALVRKHGARFAGGINHVCSRDKMKFQLGFLDHCVIGRDMVGRRYWEEAAMAPQWATVRTVELDAWGKIPNWWFKMWLSKGALASLREISIVSLRLTRASAGALWVFEKAPARLEWSVNRTFEPLLRGFDVAQLRALITPGLNPMMVSRIEEAIEDVS